MFFIWFAVTAGEGLGAHTTGGVDPVPTTNTVPPMPGTEQGVRW